MKYQKYATTYATRGNLALKNKNDLGFVLIEGGRGPAQATDTHQQEPQRVVLSRANSIAIATVIVVAMVVMLAASCFVDSMAASQRAGLFEAADTAVIRVAEGQSLWGIAEAHPVEGCSVQDVISYIKEVNDLSTSTIFAGQQLIVPATQVHEG